MCTLSENENYPVLGTRIPAKCRGRQSDITVITWHDIDSIGLVHRYHRSLTVQRFKVRVLVTAGKFLKSWQQAFLVSYEEVVDLSPSSCSFAWLASKPLCHRYHFCHICLWAGTWRAVRIPFGGRGGGAIYWAFGQTTHYIKCIVWHWYGVVVFKSTSQESGPVDWWDCDSVEGRL